MIRDFATKDDWLAWRDTLTVDLTASELAAVAGLSPYCSPAMLWLRKRHPHLASWPTGNHLDRGLNAERDLRSIYAGRTGALVTPNGHRVYSHPCGWLHATPDAGVWFDGAGDGGGLELKLDSVYGADKAWPEDGAEIRDVRGQSLNWPEGPGCVMRPDYWLQAQCQMACTGWRWVDFCVQLITPNAAQYRVFRVHHEPAEWARAFAFAERWRELYLLGPHQPPGDAGDFDALERLAKSWYPERPKQRDMTDEEQALAVEYVGLKAQEEAIDRRKREIRTELISSAGDCKRLDGDGVRFRSDVKFKITIEATKERKS